MISGASTARQWPIRCEGEGHVGAVDQNFFLEGRTRWRRRRGGAGGAGATGGFGVRGGIGTRSGIASGTFTFALPGLRSRR